MDFNQLCKNYIENRKKTDPNFLGEMLRNYAFVPDQYGDYGCYSTFETHPDFKPVDKDSELGKKLILALNEWWDDDDADGEDLDFIREACSLYSAGDIYCAWYWDGDGTLLFVLEKEKAAVINTDCKTDYEWKWLEWKD